MTLRDVALKRVELSIVLSIDSISVEPPAAEVCCIFGKIDYRRLASTSLVISTSPVASIIAKLCLPRFSYFFLGLIELPLSVILTPEMLSVSGSVFNRAMMISSASTLTLRCYS